MQRLSEREKRTMTIGAMVAALILGIRFVGPLSAGGEEAGLREKRELLARLQAIAARREETTRAFEQALSRRGRLRRYLVAETNPNLAGATLSSLVEEVAGSSGLEVVRTQILPADTLEAALQRIPVTVAARGDIHGLRGLLSAVAAHEPTLVMESLRISSEDDPQTAAGRGPSLELQATVVGFALLPQGGGPRADENGNPPQEGPS